MSLDERPRREFDLGTDRWLAIDAWRDSADLGLCYLLPLEGGDPAPDDREDRRAILEPGQSLDSLDIVALESVWGSGTHLTDTERRFTGPDGAVWLARSTGPVWAEASGATDSTGVLLRCITAARPDVEIMPAGAVRDVPSDRLREMLATEAGS